MSRLITSLMVNTWTVTHPWVQPERPALAADMGAALVTVNNVPYAMIIVDAEGRNAVFPVQGAVIAVMTFAGSRAAGAMPGLVTAWTGGSLEEAARTGWRSTGPIR